jgi:PIN domain nuclease of toxin-antitoxin system
MGGNRVMLLDTCAMLWLAHDQNKIGRETLDLIAETPVVYISAVSAFEIGLKHKAGKLHLPVSPKSWFQKLIKHHHIEVIDLDWDICIKATELPDIHKDPCDRFIIATALIKQLPVVTADKRFEAYGVQVYI